MTEPAEPLLFDDEADEGDADAIAAPLEALLLMATEPVSTVELAQAVRAPVRVVERTLAGLADFYDQTQRGFELRYVAGGWRYWTRPEYAELIGEWLIEGQHAYRQGQGQPRRQRQRQPLGQAALRGSGFAVGEYIESRATGRAARSAAISACRARSWSRQPCTSPIA